MKAWKKLVVGTATLAALVSAPMAEEIVIAGQVAPIAALVPIGGNTNLNWNNLMVATPTGPDDATPVAKFFVNTNMPQWNVYISFANGGRLLNSRGKGLDVTAADGTYPAFDVAGLIFDQNLAAEDDDGNVFVGGTEDMTADGVPLAVATLADLQSFTSILNGAAFCHDGLAVDNCVLANNWITGTGINSFGVDVMAAWDSDLVAGRVAPTLAGTYSEIIYVTLATSY